MAGIESTLCSILSPYTGYDLVFRADSKLQYLLKDSLDKEEALLDIEDEFLLDIPYGIAEQWETLGDVRDYIHRHRKDLP